MSLVLYEHNREALAEPLSAALTSTLAACFSTRGLGTLDQQQLASTYLMDLRQREYWLACGCRGIEAKPPPLMSPRLREGRPHIWRHGSVSHAPECPFYVEPDHVSNGVSTAPRPEAQAWLQPADCSDEQMGRLLLTTLHDVGYTTVVADDISTARDRKAASKRKDAYAALDLLHVKVITDELNWKDLGCTFLPGLRRHLGHLEALTSRFPSSTPPQGWFVGIVHEIHDLPGGKSQLLWTGGKERRTCIEEVAHRVTPLGGSAGSPGPYWVLARLMRQPTQQHFSVARAVSYPCLSRSVLLPIASDAQRETAEALLSQVTYWAKPTSFGLSVHLEKPLLAKASDEAQALLADFVLWLPKGQRILVNTVPSNETPEARSSRLTHMTHLKALPDVASVVEHQPGEVEPLRFAKLLSGILAHSR